MSAVHAKRFIQMDEVGRICFSMSVQNVHGWAKRGYLCRRWEPPSRAAVASSSPDRGRRSPRASRKRSVHQCQHVDAAAPEGAHGDQRWCGGCYDRLRPIVRRLLQRNLHRVADLAPYPCKRRGNSARLPLPPQRGLRRHSRFAPGPLPVWARPHTNMRVKIPLS